jgi:outer membrane protein assembly factor BamB
MAPDSGGTSVDGECYTATCGDGDGVYVGLTDGRVTALDATTGERRWGDQVATPEACCPDIQGTPTVTDGRLYVAGIAEELVAVDTADGAVQWRTAVVDDDSGNPVPSPAVRAGAAYVNTYGGGLVAIETSDGTIRWRSSESGDGHPPLSVTGVLSSHGATPSWPTRRALAGGGRSQSPSPTSGWRAT